MLDATFFSATNESLVKEVSSISEGITWLSAQFDSGKKGVGDICDQDVILATVRRVSGVTQFNAYRADVVNNLDLDLSTPIKFEGFSSNSQSIATNITVGGSISFGNLEQS